MTAAEPGQPAKRSILRTTMAVMPALAFAGSLVFSAFKDSPLVPVLVEERLARPEKVPALIGSVLPHGSSCTRSAAAPSPA